MSKPLDREGFVEKYVGAAKVLHQCNLARGEGKTYDGKLYGAAMLAFGEMAADLDALLAQERERCAKIAASASYMSTSSPPGGNFGGPSSCEYGCGAVIAAAIRRGQEGGG